MNAPVIVQYWHAPMPPDDVRSLMASWKLTAEKEGFAYLAFDDGAAEMFIREHFDQRTLSAYQECAVPAMKADFFRTCALMIRPGLYVDADMRRTGAKGSRAAECDMRAPLMPLFERLERGLLFKRVFDEGTRIANGFIVVKKSGDALIRAVLETAIDNIEKRISNNIYLVTGPGIATKWFNKFGPQHALFDGFEFWTQQELQPYMIMVGGLPYKASDDHWVNAQKNRSIFRTK